MYLNLLPAPGQPYTPDDQSADESQGLRATQIMPDKFCPWIAKARAIPFLHHDPSLGGPKVPGLFADALLSKAYEIEPTTVNGYNKNH
jgi:hypothetical protein